MYLVTNTKEYWPFILKLRNELRSNFISQDVISEEEHLGFMEKVGDKYYICLKEGIPAGWIGVIDNDIRLAVDPVFQRQGIGKFMLSEIKVAFPRASSKIFFENVSSQNLFKSLDIDFKVIYSKCVVIQGPQDYFDEIEKSYNSNYTIISTWDDFNKNTEFKYMNHKMNPIIYRNLSHKSPDHMITFTWNRFNYKDTEFKYITQKMPPSMCRNLNRQALSTYNGCLRAKEMGYKYVLKVRQDIVFTDIDSLIKILDINKFCFYTYYNLKNKKYLTDFMVGGPVDKMLELWDSYDIESGMCPEEHITKRFLNMKNRPSVEFLMKILIDNDIGCRWLKLGYDLRDNISQKEYDYTRWRYDNA